MVLTFAADKDLLLHAFFDKLSHHRVMNYKKVRGWVFLLIYTILNPEKHDRIKRGICQEYYAHSVNSEKRSLFLSEQNLKEKKRDQHNISCIYPHVSFQNQYSNALLLKITSLIFYLFNRYPYYCFSNYK